MKMHPIPAERIESRILLVRGQRVLLDTDLATRYGVPVSALNQAVKRNLECFPGDFMFQLTWEEVEDLRSQTVILNKVMPPAARRGRHVKYRPYVFTEQGVAMLSSVLRSKRAVQVNVEIMREIGEVKELVAGLGPRARAGTPREAAAFGEVVLISVPYAALPQIGRDLAAELKGKVVLETGNPVQARDGDMAVEARAKGTGVASAEFLPGVRLVRAFNSVGYNSIRSEAHRSGERVAIPLAADDEAALKIAIRLVEDAGFEPVVVGPLARAKEFDYGTPVLGKALTARELRKVLGIAS